MSTSKVVAAFALLLLAIATPAAANEFAFDFESSGNYSIVGTITTSDALNVLGNYDVTDIAGTVNGSPMGSLLANPNQPYVYNAPDGNFWDNNLSPIAPYVTFNGIGFNFGSVELVLFSDITGDPLSEGVYVDNEGSFTQFQGTLSVTQVAAPEPATWGLLLVGLLGMAALCLASRRKIRATPVV